MILVYLNRIAGIRVKAVKKNCYRSIHSCIERRMTAMQEKKMKSDGFIPFKPGDDIHYLLVLQDRGIQLYKFFQ